MTDAADATDSARRELLQLNQRLLDCIIAADWETYRDLCDPTLSAFEPEARGHLVEGLEFHHFYFDRGTKPARLRATMCSPHVRLLSDDSAVVSYVRLMQRSDDAGTAVTTATEETRIWQRQEGRWRHVHFHRSTNA